MEKDKRLKLAYIMLVAVVLLQILVQLFMPLGVSINTGAALLTPIGAPHIIAFELQDERPFNPYSRSMTPANVELSTRVQLAAMEKEKHGDNVYSSDGLYEWTELRSTALRYLFIWGFLAVEIVLTILKRKREKKGTSKAFVIAMIAAMLSANLWAEVLYGICGIVYPILSYGVALGAVLCVYCFFPEEVLEGTHETID